MLAGIQTQPAVLAYALEKTGRDSPNVGYASVFPIAMISKILLAQVILQLDGHWPLSARLGFCIVAADARNICVWSLKLRVARRFPSPACADFRALAAGLDVALCSTMFQNYSASATFDELTRRVGTTEGWRAPGG